MRKSSSQHKSSRTLQIITLLITLTNCKGKQMTKNILEQGMPFSFKMIMSESLTVTSDVISWRFLLNVNRKGFIFYQVKVDEQDPSIKVISIKHSEAKGRRENCGSSILWFSVE
ncbi:CLUMA_CG010211, isoform A [Clunio marinus]|uniref:CLUMA_CG010211, isoform A n=1 Tax=Clunio marinus TaxID=568069 RepID=A0A1J1I958_9DIPT|nr:CLUMA_CG010211, isoform A [Clunio marinus]